MLTYHSYYSLRYGTLSPEALVKAAKAKGVDTMILTDINNTSCSFTFIEACKKHEIKPVLGIEFRDEEDKLLYIGIAKNELGFRELNGLLTDCSLDGHPLPKAFDAQLHPPFKHAFILYPMGTRPAKLLAENEFIAIRPHEVNTLFRSPLMEYQNKLVAWNPVTFLDEEGYKTHKLLRAIDLNTILTKLQPQDLARPSEKFYTPQEFEQYYQQYPFLITQSKTIIQKCEIRMESGFQNNKQTFTGNKKDDLTLLNKLALNGCERRYGEDNIEALERTKRELKVIERMGFAPYFLITWDIIRYAQTAGFHHVGRGSGANSIVAFCLYITDVDPLELDLYFERFINPFRTSPPDFDIDFSWDERDDVTDYIFKRYGREHTALLATYSTFKGKSIIRELGKVFGLPKEEIDVIVEQPLATEKHHGLASQIFKYGKKIEGFPNYLSIHAGGVLITERPINYFTALKMMPKGFPITHFDMYGAEDLGLHKYDILSQRGLGHIKEAVVHIERNQGKAINIRDVKKIKEDKRVRGQLKSGHCIGCFYIESPAMRGLLTKLACDNYLTLVAASSIIRPGVAKSGMMREYIHRFHNPHSFNYIHPVFEQHLGETFGVMVYQEDVMKICHHFSGLGMDESDVLRRIMSGKKKTSDTFRKLRDKYFENCERKGYDPELSKEVWRQIESFSGYSFCKAHSASYAVESFQSLYLKAYYPLEFMVAVINNFGGFYQTEVYVHEARMQGAKIHAPCINKSLWLTTIYGKDIFIGFVHLHQMERNLAKRLIKERRQNGNFRSLEDFVNRVDVGPEQLDNLIRISAFRFTGKNKYELMWTKNGAYDPKAKLNGSGFLFGNSHEVFQLPQLQEGNLDQAFDEIELLGFPLSSPFYLLENSQKLRNNFRMTARDFMKYTHKTVTILGYYVTRKNVTTVNRKLMNFGTWLDREGRFFDTTHFPPCLSKYPFRGKGCYLITGKIVLDFDFPSIEVIKMEKLPYVKDERYA